MRSTVACKPEKYECKNIAFGQRFGMLLFV